MNVFMLWNVDARYSLTNALIPVLSHENVM